MHVSFFKPSITQSEIDEVIDSLRSGWLTTGPKVKQLEREFADYMGHKHAVALNSCTAALHLALEAIGLKAGDTAVVPTMTFAATAEVVRYFGAKPLLVDCQERDFNLDVADASRRVEQALARGERVVAILPVHYGGQVADVSGVTALARRYGLRVIEDAAHCCPAYFRSQGSPRNRNRPDGQGSDVRCQAAEVTLSHTLSNPELESSKSGSKPSARDGAPALPAGVSPKTLSNRGADWLPVGATADICCFSFYANKCITTGEGGMACTHNDAFAERMRIMSLHGISKDAWKRFTAEGSWYYEIVAPGFKYNMTDLAAAIGIHQLRRADAMHRQRAHWARLYSELLADVEELILPVEQPDRVHSWHLYVIRLRLARLKIDRAAVIEELKKAGIGISVHWMPLHMHPYYRETYGYKPEDYPVAASLYPQIITLPLFPDMLEEQVVYVCNTLRSIIAANLKVSRASS